MGFERLVREFERQVRERIEAILDGDTPPEELTGATSVRCATGLVLRSLEGITTLSESDAWDYLDAHNVVLVDALQNEYRDRVDRWRERCLSAKTEREAIEAAQVNEARKPRNSAFAAEINAANAAFAAEMNALFDEIETRRAASRLVDDEPQSERV